MKILLTGGAGYIGSHVAKKLLSEKIEVVVIDNLSNGHKDSVDKKAEFIYGDINNERDLANIFSKHQFDAIFHIAAFADLRESLQDPIKFWENNVFGTLNLLKFAQKHKCHKFIFASSFSVYGNLEKMPANEQHPTNPTNPYSRTKLISEQLLKDCQSWGLQSIALRYPNVTGCSLNGEIGEDMNPFIHVLPKIILAARDGGKFEIYGKDFDTKDGTGVREYIHVEDLANVHFKALQYLNSKKPNAMQCNVGSGKSYSVKEIIEATERITGKKVDFSVGERKYGDVGELVSDSSFAQKEFQWKANHSDIDTIIQSCWNWFAQPHQGKYKE